MAIRRRLRCLSRSMWGCGMGVSGGGSFCCWSLSAAALPGDRHWCVTDRGKPDYGVKKRRAMRGVFRGASRSSYLDTDRLNMRSIFSLVESQQDWLACAAARAWLAVLCAPLAAWLAEEAALEAESAALLAEARSDCRRLT